MSGKELYEKYKGRKVSLYGSVGVICGHDNFDMIMSVNEVHDSNQLLHLEGWIDLNVEDVIVINKDNPLGYHYVNEKYIID